jgi:hypothetical protein
MTGFPSTIVTAQGATSGNFALYQAVVGQVPVQLYPTLKNPSFVRIYNTSPGGGPNLYLSRYLGAAVAPNTPGCIMLAPGAFEDFRIPAVIPSNAVWVVADGPNCGAMAEVF